MSDVTRILSQIESGDPQAAEQLLPLVYEELRKLAAAKMVQEPTDHMLQATALVHEAYLRLLKDDADRHWDSRGHFFSAAAEAMRRILIESAREKATGKRGGDWNRISLDAVVISGGAGPEELLSLNEAFEELEAQDPQAAEIARLRIFAGMTVGEISEVLRLGQRTVDRLWAFARAWLRTQLTEG